MKRYLDRITTSKVFLGVIAALLLYALAGFALAPACSSVTCRGMRRSSSEAR